MEFEGIGVVPYKQPGEDIREFFVHKIIHSFRCGTRVLGSDQSLFPVLQHVSVEVPAPQ